MAVPLDEFIGALPEEQRAAIEARAEELHAEVASLRELRGLLGKAQTEVARTLGIKQPSVSKIERQTDLYLSTLRAYVEAVGGELELIVRLPDREPLRLRSFSPDEAAN